MGTETYIRMYFYAQCPHCRKNSAVDIDNLKTSELLLNFLMKSNFCFTLRCKNCKDPFVAQIGEANEKGCSLCEIRTNCLESGSSPLMYIHSSKIDIMKVYT